VLLFAASALSSSASSVRVTDDNAAYSSRIIDACDFITCVRLRPTTLMSHRYDRLILAVGDEDYGPCFYGLGSVTMSMSTARVCCCSLRATSLMTHRISYVEIRRKGRVHYIPSILRPLLKSVFFYPSIFLPAHNRAVRDLRRTLQTGSANNESERSIADKRIYWILRLKEHISQYIFCTNF